MKRFQLQDHGELGRLADFMFDDVAGDFLRQGKWKTHNLFYRGNRGGSFGKQIGRIRWTRIGFQKMPGPRQKKIQRRNTAALMNAAATRDAQRKHREHCQPQHIPV